MSISDREADKKDQAVSTGAKAGTFNTEQKTAIEYGDGPLCIVAGPGSGKTRTLTARIAYLIQQAHVPPEHIVALTFTNKAAHEMRERVSTLLGVEAKATLISTFHALARTLLGDKTSLVDEPTRIKIIHGIIHTRHMKGRSVRDVGLGISRAKNQLEPVSDPVIAELVQAYDAELTTMGLQDFDDLLRNLHTALVQGTSPEKPQFRHILVDEFQDTNALQYAILQLLDTTGNVFVIGDPLQSIYGFRGASAGVFDQFERDWPETRRITLYVNYRSAPKVVGLANTLFPDAPQLSAHRPNLGKACLVEVLNEYGEADWIVSEIERQIGGSDMLRSDKYHAAGTGRTFSDFAVLYRTHAAAKTLQAALEASGIPYQIAGEGSPYFDPAVQIVLQSLGFLEGRIEAVEAEGFTSPQLKRVLVPLKDSSIVPEASNIVVLTGQIIEKLGLSYEKHPKLRQFTNSLLAFKPMKLSAYLDHVATMAEQAYYDPTAEAVTLLTIHAAKGLEFPCVFLVGAEEGILPYALRGTGSGVQLDKKLLAEEKRLFYVAVTRVRDELYLLHARTRRKEPQTVSSFVSALPVGIISYLTDPELGNQQRKLQRRAQKRAQGSLF
jgi:DNA helicase-2/ATP-dependent DNA helicase PcrA